MAARNTLCDEMLQCMPPTFQAEDDGPALTATEEQESDPLHPDAKRLFAACPWTRSIPIFGEACQAYGPKCTMSLAMCYLLCKGIADQSISYARYAMFRMRYGVTPQRYQRLANISTMGWSIKALTAMLCDSFAFFGYTKRWYMMISCFVGAAFALAYGLLPAKESSADTAAAFVFLTAYGKANVDILSEGHYSRLMRKIPKAGPALVSWIWIFIMIGAVIASGIQGPLGDAKIPQVGVFISAFLQFITGFIFVFNWYGERLNRVERADDARFMHEEAVKERERLALILDEQDVFPEKDLHPERHSDDEAAIDALNNVLSDDLQIPKDSAIAAQDYAEFELPEPIPCCCGVFEFNKEVALRNWRVVVYSVIMTCAVVTMTCGNILADTLGLLIICVVVSLVCCGASFWALPLVIAKANVFGYLSMVVYLQLPGATDSFFLADAECAPNGPQFSLTFYNTVAAVIGNVAGVIGVACFNYIFSKRGYHLTFIVTVCTQVLGSLFDIVMVKRWNLVAGIPDHAMFICGDTIVYQVCYMLNWMPLVVLLSRLCPRGSESVVYALMAGFSNLGQSTSSAIGAILMEYAWPVITDVTPCDFSNVPWLLVVGHIILPLTAIPLVLLLIPRARVCDDLDIDGNVIRKQQQAALGVDGTVVNDAAEPYAEAMSGKSHDGTGEAKRE